MIKIYLQDLCGKKYIIEMSRDSLVSEFKKKITDITGYPNPDYIVHIRQHYLMIEIL